MALIQTCPYLQWKLHQKSWIKQSWIKLLRPNFSGQKYEHFRPHYFFFQTQLFLQNVVINKRFFNEDPFFLNLLEFLVFTVNIFTSALRNLYFCAIKFCFWYMEKLFIIVVYIVIVYLTLLCPFYMEIFVYNYDKVCK